MPGGEEIDVVVLACTHFPLLHDELGEAIGAQVRLVDGAEGIARRIAHLTEGQTLRRSSPDLAVTTGPVSDFTNLLPALSALGIERVESV
jgi:glutamate racemase